MADDKAARRAVGRRIRSWRRFLGLTCLQLASAAGLAYETVKDVEAGRGSGQSPSCAKIAAILGIPHELMVSCEPIEALSLEEVRRALYAFAVRRVFEPEVVKGGVIAYRRRFQEAPGYYRDRRRQTAGVAPSTAEAA
jgi:transcriptional regulator with XRE-family HTH domain